MSGPSRSETLAEIFRQEALAHRSRAVMRQGDPLRSSAARLQWLTWTLVVALAVGVALAGSLELDEFASGPAIVRVESAEAPGSCLVIGYLPAHHQSAIRRGATARFAPTAPGTSSYSGSAQSGPSEIRLERVEPQLLSADTVGRLLQNPAFSSGGEAMVAVIGRLDPHAVLNGGRRLECREGLRGVLEVRLPPRRLISALVPGTSLPSASH